MSRHGRHRVGGHVDAIAAGSVPEGESLAVRLARNVPNLEGTVGRSRNDALVGIAAEEAHARDLVLVTDQMVDLGVRFFPVAARQQGNDGGRRKKEDKGDGTYVQQ